MADSQSLLQQLQNLEEEEQHRHVDLAFLLQHKHTGETLLAVGGVWDRVEKRYTGKTPTTAKICKVNPAQVDFVRRMAPEIKRRAAGHSSDTRLAVAIGDRRAGKTVAALQIGVASAIAQPRVGWHGFIEWVVGVSRPEMEELDRYLRWLLPAGWYRYSAQKKVFHLANGAAIITISADDPRTVKRGESNLVILNEGQKMPVTVLSNSIMGTVDNGGLALVAANPPEDRRGEWVWRVRRGVKNGVVKYTDVFDFDSRLNDDIDQGARSQAVSILMEIDPDTARIDGQGEFILQEGKALPFFENRLGGHVRPRPRVGLVDVTPLVTYRKIGRAYQSLCGQDYQQDPFLVGVEVKVFATQRYADWLEGIIEHCELDPRVDLPLYWAINEVYAQGSEHDLCDAMWVAGMRPERTYCVGDGSGQWQNGRHAVGDTSFDILRARRWRVEPPFMAQTDAGARPQNPKIRYRVGLARRLCGMPPDEAERRRVPPIEPRFFVEEQLERGRRYLEDAELRPGKNGELKPVGREAHFFDALTYVFCHLEPLPQDQTTQGQELPDHLEEMMRNLQNKRRLR